MRPRFGLLIGWIMVTATAVLVTFAAVGSVRDNVTDAAAPAFRVASGAAAAQVGEGITTSTSAPRPSADSDLDGAAGLPAASITQPTEAESQPNDDRSAAAAGTASTTSTTSPPAAPTEEPPPQVKTYNLVGGSVTIEAGNGAVTLLGAVPNSGFTAKEEDADDRDEVVVEFESGTHKSKIKIEFDGGTLVADIEEEPRG